MTLCLLPWSLASSWPASTSGHFYVDLEITVHLSVIPWSLSIWPSPGQMWLILWAPLFTLMCFPSPSRTTWPGTLSGPPVLLNLDSVCQICFYTHLTQTDLRVCAHTHPQHTHIHNIHTTHTRHTTHIHIIILGMPQDVTYSHTPFLHLLGSDPETQSDPTVLKVQ